MGKETVKFVTLYTVYTILPPKPATKHLKFKVRYLTVTLRRSRIFLNAKYVVKLLMMVRQKQNLEQDLIIIKVHTGPKEKKRKIPQQHFHELYMQHRCNGIGDWQLKLIAQCETHEQLKEREIFWQHRLKTFHP